MKNLKKIILKVNDFLGVTVPVILYIMLFLSFVIVIFARYIFSKSISWGNEVAILCYIWIMFFGCGKAMENDEHVVFSLIYDEVSPLVQLIMKLIYNTVLIVFMIVSFKPCIVAWQASTQITGILKLTYKFCFFPFFWMMLMIIIYSCVNIKKSLDEYKIEKDKPRVKKKFGEANAERTFEEALKEEQV